MNKLGCYFTLGLRRFSTDVKPFCYVTKFKEFTEKGNYVNAADVIKRAPPSSEKTKAILDAMPFYIKKAQEANAKERNQECWNYRHVACLVQSPPSSSEKTDLVQKYMALLTEKDEMLGFEEKNITSHRKDVMAVILQRKEPRACISLIEMGSSDPEEQDAFFSDLIERIAQEGYGLVQKGTKVDVTISNHPYAYIGEVLRTVPEGPRRGKLLRHAVQCLKEQEETVYAKHLKTQFSPLHIMIAAAFKSREISDCIVLIEMGSSGPKEEDELFSDLIEQIAREGCSSIKIEEDRLKPQPVAYAYIKEILGRVPEGPRREKLQIHAVQCLEKKKEIDYLDSVKTQFSPLRSLMGRAFSPVKLRQVEQKIDALLAKRLSNPDEELERLRYNPEIATSLDNLNKAPYIESCKIKQICIGRSMELQKGLKNEGYYVINHGQNNKAAVINLTSTVIHELKTKQELKHFEILRDSYFLNQIPENRTLPALKKALQSYETTDHEFRDELLSGDIQLTSTAESESAIDFFARRTSSVAERQVPDFVKNQLGKIVNSYIGNEEFGKQITEDILDACKDVSGGILYSICIPKGKFDSLAYPALPFGIPIEHVPSFDLDAWQEGLTPRKLTPQVRLATKELTSENGVFILPHSVLTPSQRQNIKSTIQHLLQKYAT